MGRPRKNVDSDSAFQLKCMCCGEDKLASEKGIESNFYKSNSQIHVGYNCFIPLCKDCLEKMYNKYSEIYSKEIEKKNMELDYEIELEEYYIEKKTIKRICMMNDIYYSDKVFENALKSNTNTMLAAYMKTVNLIQYRKKTFDKTIEEEEIILEEETVDDYDDTKNLKKVNKKTVRFFGTGFSEDDYEFLQQEYVDWTTRHECKTKAQEEVFKQICFTQLELLKATRAKQDTKDLRATFQKLLETAKLQPKQNHSDTMSETQTFGTLIDKWENTRPLPEIDEELKDVDKIGLYVDVFFKGHLSKMMGLKNAFSNLYTKFMKKYTVDKPEYNSDDNSEVIFDAVFGNHPSDE